MKNDGERGKRRVAFGECNGWMMNLSSRYQEEWIFEYTRNNNSKLWKNFDIYGLGPLLTRVGSNWC